MSRNQTQKNLSVNGCSTGLMEIKRVSKQEIPFTGDTGSSNECFTSNQKTSDIGHQSKSKTRLGLSHQTSQSSSHFKNISIKQSFQRQSFTKESHQKEHKEPQKEPFQRESFLRETNGTGRGSHIRPTTPLTNNSYSNNHTSAHGNGGENQQIRPSAKLS